MMRPRARTMVGLLACLALAAGGRPAGAAARLEDRPVVWYEDDRREIARPAARDPNVMWDGIASTFVHPVGRLLNPGRLVRRAGTVFGGDPVPPAADVNALDEALNSTWFTNRIGLGPIAANDLLEFGEAAPGGPDTTAAWTVVGAKTQGVTPGLNIRDRRGVTYVLKFDPPGFEGTASAAGAISGRILHAAGYNVPADNVVTFRREDLVLGEGVSLKLDYGARRPMAAADIDSLLARVEPGPDGRRRAIASRFVSGKPIGPFDYHGRRADDPNDRIDHEDRRELRGLRLFAAWLGHFDTKQGNSLDTWSPADAAPAASGAAPRGYVTHYLIDFASTLGAGADGLVARHNYEFTIDPPAIAGRVLAAGFHEDEWRRVERPAGLAEIGYFDSEHFDPLEWKPNAPNTAFANLTDRDGYWAARIISAFTDDDLRRIVARGRYRDPRAADFMARTLAARRNIIARVMFDRVPPLDFFRFDGRTIRFHDLGVERGIYSLNSGYRMRASLVTAGRDVRARSEWVISPAPEFDAAALLDSGNPGPREAPFLRIEAQVDRGRGWSSTVSAYFARASGRVVAVER